MFQINIRENDSEKIPFTQSVRIGELNLNSPTAIICRGRWGRPQFVKSVHLCIEHIHKELIS